MDRGTFDWKIEGEARMPGSVGSPSLALRFMIARTKSELLYYAKFGLQMQGTSLHDYPPCNPILLPEESGIP